MSTKNYFSHWPEYVDGKLNSDKYTVNLEMRKLLTKNCVNSSENIFWAKYNKHQSAVEWWMNSKPHKEAMLDASYQMIGIGINN